MGYTARGLRIGPPLGSRNPASVLTEDQVREIKARHRPHFNTAELAREYRVSRNTINAIYRKEIWAWLD